MTALPAAALRALGAAAVTTLGYLLFLDHRPDYAGHYVAGFGAVLVLAAAPYAKAKEPLAWGAVWPALALIAIGVLTEATVFQVAIFDPVDFNNQSLGACLAGLCLLGSRGTQKEGLVLACFGFLLISAGFLLAFS